MSTVTTGGSAKNKEDTVFHYSVPKDDGANVVEGESDFINAKKLGEIQAQAAMASEKGCSQKVCGAHDGLVELITLQVEYALDTRNHVRNLINLFTSLRRWIRGFVAILAFFIPVLAPLAWEKWVGKAESKPAATTTTRAP